MGGGIVMGVVLGSSRVDFHVWVRRLVLCPIAIAGTAWAQSDTRPADPFTAEQRIQYFVQRTFSWQKMTRLGADTAVEHPFCGCSRGGGGSSRVAARYF